MSATHLPGHVSSPLRQGSSEPAGLDELDMNEDGEWVKRTEGVHIASEAGDEAAESTAAGGIDEAAPSLQEQYSQLLRRYSS